MKNTIQNLAKAFVGESQARNRYAFYSKVAKKEAQDETVKLLGFLAERVE